MKPYGLSITCECGDDSIPGGVLFSLFLFDFVNGIRAVSEYRG